MTKIIKNISNTRIGIKKYLESLCSKLGAAKNGLVIPKTKPKWDQGRRMLPFDLVRIILKFCAQTERKPAISYKTHDGFGGPVFQVRKKQHVSSHHCVWQIHCDQLVDSSQEIAPEVIKKLRSKIPWMTNGKMNDSEFFSDDAKIY